MSKLESPIEGIEVLDRLLKSVPGGLGLPQLWALVSVGTVPGMSINDLAERINAPQQTASRYVAQLMGRYQDIIVSNPPTPLVEQRISIDDPRKRALYLTDQGRKIISALLRAGWENEIG